MNFTKCYLKMKFMIMIQKLMHLLQDFNGKNLMVKFRNKILVTIF